MDLEQVKNKIFTKNHIDLMKRGMIEKKESGTFPELANMVASISKS